MVLAFLRKTAELQLLEMAYGFVGDVTIWAQN